MARLTTLTAACPRIVGLACVLWIAPASSQADYKEAYKKGLDAIGAKKWSEAIRLMQQAIGEKPTEGEPIRLYGQRFETYLPHYYLGVALHGSGSCEGAVKAFGESESQGAIRKSGEYKNLTRSRTACEVQLAKATPASPATPAPSRPTSPDPAAVTQAAQVAEGEIAKADEALRALGSLQSDPLLSGVWGQDVSLGPAQQRARETLAQANGRLAEGRARGDVAAIQQAQLLGRKAAELAEGVRVEAARKRSDLRSASFRAEEEDRRRATTVASPVPATPSPSTARGTSVAPSAPADQPAKPSHPPHLLAAARAYFAGEYRRAAELLPEAESFGGRAAAQGVAFRAAARYATFLATGERDAALLEKARGDLRTLRRMDRGFTLDGQSFSPRVVAFFRSVP